MLLIKPKKRGETRQIWQKFINSENGFNMRQGYVQDQVTKKLD